MTDAHYHRNTYGTFLSVADREYRFLGVHPWQIADGTAVDRAALRERLVAEPGAGVGEIGLDRLRSRAIGPEQRAAFAEQLALAAELRRPAVLHGAKCWGEVVQACRPLKGRIPAFLFHGFSRSGGLLPEIYTLNGFVSVGPAVLNDHAVNYRVLVTEIDADRLLLETDLDVGGRDALEDSETAAVLRRSVLSAVAALRRVDPGSLASAIDANARRFVEALG